MLLAIDIGNTETVLGIYRGKRLSAHGRFSSTSHRTADECRLLFRLWAGEKRVALPAIRGAVISSVVPSLTALFARAVKEAAGVESLVVDSDTDTGLVIRYDSPRAVGADRICNAVAGFARYGGPVVVVDFGTATTFDVVSGSGEYLGGAITLGVKHQAVELHRVAAKLPKVDLVFPEAVVGRTTESSMQSGLMWGTVAMIDGMIERIASENGWSRRLAVVATGGLAQRMEGKSKRIQAIEPFLTLEGMRIIYERVGRSGRKGGRHDRT